MSLINRRRVKLYALDVAKGKAHKFTRVSKEFYVSCERWLIEKIEAHIKMLPSRGKTIK